MGPSQQPPLAQMARPFLVFVVRTKMLCAEAWAERNAARTGRTAMPHWRSLRKCSRQSAAAFSRPLASSSAHSKCVHSPPAICIYWRAEASLWHMHALLPCRERNVFASRSKALGSGRLWIARTVYLGLMLFKMVCLGRRAYPTLTPTWWRARWAWRARWRLRRAPRGTAPGAPCWRPRCSAWATRRSRRGRHSCCSCSQLLPQSTLATPGLL